jgi:hypothetical protein
MRDILLLWAYILMMRDRLRLFILGWSEGILGITSGFLIS